MDSYQRDGLRFDVVEQGPADGPVVLLLHGFPQTSDSWTPVAARLAAAGYRTLAPDQRGYSPGARPRGRRAYAIGELVDDTVALIEAAGHGPDRPVHVVGHDWGAAVAWALAAAHPELVASVTGVSVPHMGAFTRSFARSRQGLLSWYMYVFQLPVLPERFLTRPGAFVAALVRAGQSREAARRDEAAFAARGGLGPTLTGGLNWYRAIPFAASSSMVDPSSDPVRPPSLMVWSDGDVAVSRAAIEGNADFVRGPYRLEVLPGISHWIPDEAPGRLADLVIEHVAGA